MRFEGQTAIVTGAARGIGEAIVFDAGQHNEVLVFAS